MTGEQLRSTKAKLDEIFSTAKLEDLGIVTIDSGYLFKIRQEQLSADGNNIFLAKQRCYRIALSDEQVEELKRLKLLNNTSISPLGDPNSRYTFLDLLFTDSRLWLPQCWLYSHEFYVGMMTRLIDLLGRNQRDITLFLSYMTKLAIKEMKYSMSQGLFPIEIKAQQDNPRKLFESWRNRVKIDLKCFLESYPAMTEAQFTEAWGITSDSCNDIFSAINKIWEENESELVDAIEERVELRENVYDQRVLKAPCVATDIDLMLEDNEEEDIDFSMDVPETTKSSTRPFPENGKKLLEDFLSMLENTPHFRALLLEANRVSVSGVSLGALSERVASSEVINVIPVVNAPMVKVPLPESGTDKVAATEVSDVKMAGEVVSLPPDPVSAIITANIEPAKDTVTASESHMVEPLRECEEKHRPSVMQDRRTSRHATKKTPSAIDLPLTQHIMEKHQARLNHQTTSLETKVSHVSKMTSHQEPLFTTKKVSSAMDLPCMQHIEEKHQEKLDKKPTSVETKGRSFSRMTSHQTPHFTTKKAPSAVDLPCMQHIMENRQAMLNHQTTSLETKVSRVSKMTSHRESLFTTKTVSSALALPCMQHIVEKHQEKIDKKPTSVKTKGLSVSEMTSHQTPRFTTKKVSSAMDLSSVQSILTKHQDTLERSIASSSVAASSVTVKPGISFFAAGKESGVKSRAYLASTALGGRYPSSR